VTSLATGIVTVSLMDQAPAGVTHTITQVIQQTVASVLPDSGATSTAAVSIAVNDQVADATAAVEPSVVGLRDGNGIIVGLGLVVSSYGAVMSDKNIVADLNDPEAVFSDGTSVPMAVTRFQIQGDIAFMVPSRPLLKDVTPISFGDPARLGASVWSLSGTSTYALSQGIVTELDPIASSSLSLIRTTIPASEAISGMPLFDATGKVIGVFTPSLSGGRGAIFYPVDAVKGAVPK
jgi:S1-C subfamily serine protease